MIEVKGGCCPINKDNKCEAVVDGAIVICPWFVTLLGKNPQTEEKIDKKICAVAAIPTLLIENAQMTRGVNDAVCSARDESIKHQDSTTQAVLKFNSSLQQAVMAMRDENIMLQNLLIKEIPSVVESHVRITND